MAAALSQPCDGGCPRRSRRALRICPWTRAHTEWHLGLLLPAHCGRAGPPLLAPGGAHGEPAGLDVALRTGYYVWRASTSLANPLGGYTPNGGVPEPHALHALPAAATWRPDLFCRVCRVGGGNV